MKEQDVLVVAVLVLTVALLTKLTHPKKKKTHLILTTFINNYQIKIQSIKMELNQKKFVDSILQLVDHDTQAPIEATFSDIVLESSDTEIFTIGDVNADGVLDLVGVKAGIATLNVSASATYVDANTGETVTKTKTAAVPVTVNAPAPDAENTDLVVSFTAAQDVPETGNANPPADTPAEG